jgi:hypothetical protein
MEEVAKIWTALPSANFRRSALYQVSVVQIETRLMRPTPLPVRTRRIFASTLKRPEILEAYRTPVAPADPIGDTRVVLGEEITIEGRNFIGARTWVRLGALEPIAVTPLTQGRIRLAVPDSQYPSDADHPVPRPIPVENQLQPGPLTIQVIVEHAVESVEGGLDPGITARHAREYRSNVGVVILLPQIIATSPGSGTAGALLRVDGVRLYRADLESFVLVGDATIPVHPPAVGDPWAVPSATSVEVPLSSLAQALPPPLLMGTAHAVRVQVNGAQSRENAFSFTLLP